jgi:plastocyanin
MFTSRRLLAMLAIAALAIPVFPTGIAGADDEAPMKATVRIKGVEIFRVGFVQNTWHFPEDATEIRQGGTITWINTTVEPHTISLIAKADEPTNINGNDVLGAIANAHFPTGAAPIPNLDQGTASEDADPVADFDTVSHSNPVGTPPTVGDSLLVDDANGTNGFSNTNRAQVLAAPGLYYYVCAFHPWMQGTIRVVA